MATHRVYLPGESHGQKSLEGLQSMGLQRVRHDSVTKQLYRIMNIYELIEFEYSSFHTFYSKIHFIF